MGGENFNELSSVSHAHAGEDVIGSLDVELGGYK